MMTETERGKRRPAPDSLYSKIQAFLAAHSDRPWRAKELSERMGEDAGRVSVALSQLFATGRLSRCEVTIPGTARAIFEYRDRGVTLPAAVRTLKPMKQMIIPRTPAPLSEHKPAPPVQIPPRAEAGMAAGPARETSAPAVEQNSSVRQQGAQPHEPTGEGQGCQPENRSLGETISGNHETHGRQRETDSKDRTAAFAISDDGCLGITLDDGEQTRLAPADIVAMMDFLGKTEAIWR